MKSKTIEHENLLKKIFFFLFCKWNMLNINFPFLKSFFLMQELNKIDFKNQSENVFY